MPTALAGASKRHTTKCVKVAKYQVDLDAAMRADEKCRYRELESREGKEADA